MPMKWCYLGCYSTALIFKRDQKQFYKSYPPQGYQLASKYLDANFRRSEILVRYVKPYLSSNKTMAEANDDCQM